MANTVLSGLVNPEVVADLVQAKLTDYAKVLPLADIDTTLVGRPGNTLYFPVYSYIGDASTLAEGSDLTPVALTETSTSATVVKFAQGVKITDEAALSGFGDPIGEGADQIAKSIASAEDNALLTVLASIGSAMTYSTSASTVDPSASDILDALELFGEDVDETKVALVSPAVYTQMRKSTGWLPASEIAANILVKGAVGEFGGCQVIISNKLKDVKNIYIVKPGALKVVTKKGIMVESDRDILDFTTVITGSAHAVAYLYDSSKAIKITKATA